MKNKFTIDPVIRFANHSEFELLETFSYDENSINRNNRDIWLNEAIEKNRILVPEIENQVSGMITWDYIFQYSVPLVTWIYVIEEYRHGSLTRLLIKSLCNHLREKGYTRLLYSMHESVKDPSTIAPHGFLEWPGKGKEIIYWMKI